MSRHALLSPSGAHRWLNCPPAPRLEAGFPDNPGGYALEGTLAHRLCEAAAKKHFKKIKPAEYSRTVRQCRADPLWNDEMLQTAEKYVEHISERAMAFEREPCLAFEVEVDITDYVPEAFGTCDCVMIGGGTLVITDYKHGKGVPVSPAGNPQLMLYALGALKLYRPIFGDAVQKVEIYIDQPRLGSYGGWICSADELSAWGAEIKPKAERAFMGIGEYRAGEWCRFCRAKGICKAQSEHHASAFSDFSGVTDGTPRPPALLTPAEIGAALEKGKTLVEWYESLRTKALEMLLDGCSIPGWKAVEGRSTRAWTDQDAALETLQAAGIDRAVIYDSVPKSLAQLEKVLGTAKFSELAGAFVTKPPGRPAIAPAGDPRGDFNRAAADFAAAAETEGA